jgi:hypothetical protein
LRDLERALLAAADGLPHLAPELVLLFKSRNTGAQDRPRDQSDFERVFPRLDTERRAWLRWALEVASPGHAWIARLAGQDNG